MQSSATTHEHHRHPAFARLVADERARPRLAFDADSRRMRPMGLVVLEVGLGVLVVLRAYLLAVASEGGLGLYGVVGAPHHHIAVFVIPCLGRFGGPRLPRTERRHRDSFGYLATLVGGLLVQHESQHGVRPAN